VTRTVVVCFLLATTGIAGAVDLQVPGTETHVDTSGYVDGLAIGALGGPRQRPQAITELRFQARPSKALRLQLTLRNRIGGPFEGGHPGIMNFDHEFQNRTPSLEFNEAYAELREGNLQVRAGIQKFAWGKLDGVPPTDILSPRDLHDPFVRDFEESKIGIPAVLATYFLPALPSVDLSELRASIAYIPLAVPPRLPLAEERWFPPSVRAGIPTISERRAEQLLNGVLQATVPGAPPIELDGPVNIPLTFRTLNHRPPVAFNAGGGAFRLSGTFRTVDWSISHYTGPETGPDARLVTNAFCRNCITNLANHRFPVTATTYLRQSHDVVHMTGADMSTVLGGATLRGEVAVFQNRPYLRITSQLIENVLQPKKVKQYGPALVLKGHTPVPIGELFPDRDSVEWGFGVDYLVNGFLPLLQVNQVVFTDSGPEQLLSDPETRLLGSIRRRFLQDTLEVEMRGVYAIERGAWFVFPRVTYRYGDNWRLRFGYLGIGGPEESVIGQYHDNDEFVMEARYIF